MTTHQAERRSTSRAAGAAMWRAVTWALHLLVIVLALASLLTRRFDAWADLRALGPVSTLFWLVWVGSAVLVPFCAGPRRAGWLGKCRWIHAGFAPDWALRLLWPTYVLIPCLLINTLWYAFLLRDGRADAMIPLPLVAAVVLGLWAVLTRDWVRGQSRLPASARTGILSPLAGALWVLALIAVIGGGLWIKTYARVPPGAVDLAVVLGGRMNPDSTLANCQADRVDVAIDLFRRGLVRQIMLSGAVGAPMVPGGPEINEAAAMRDRCLAAGVPEEALTLDPVGVNTKATAWNARTLMRARGWQSVVVCSSDFHLYRTQSCFAALGVNAYALPSRPALWRCADPREILRELLAVVVYRVDPSYRLPKASLMQLASPRVVVHKSKNTLDLFDGTVLVKSYSCITGGNSGDKQIEGDRKTPEGSFHIVFKNPQSKFHLSLGLDYPNADDARRGLEEGLISAQEYQQILQALQSDLAQAENQKKLWYTRLGGEIFLHGYAEGRTGTAGCVALSNGDIEELYAILPVGTSVEIRP